MNEKLVNDCVRMYRERAAYAFKWAKKYKERGEEDRHQEELTRAMAYDSAADMLVYAIEDREDNLRQYDYYGDEG